MMNNDLKQIAFKRMDGSDAKLADFEGSVVLIVNVASACGLTPQYEGLEKLYEQKREQGLVVLGFPANNFGAQEPGTNEEIAAFCTGTFGVQFPMAQKISVKGDDTHPLYAQMIAAQPTATQNPNSDLRAKLVSYGLGPANDTDVMWNFEKFLINRKGEVVGRFAPDITPADPRITAAIEAALAE
jgi:glutathione peroxidase